MKFFATLNSLYCCCCWYQQIRDLTQDSNSSLCSKELAALKRGISQQIVVANFATYFFESEAS